METLRVCEQMWSDDGAFEGERYRLAETICLPKPVRGSIPILIGGAGERKTLRLVAQYAQACNLITAAGPAGVETVKHKLEVLRGHCDRLGTDYDAIEKTILYQGASAGDPDAFLAQMEEYAALGVSLVALMPPPYEDPVPWATAVVDLVPRLQQVS